MYFVLGTISSRSLHELTPAQRNFRSNRLCKPGLNSMIKKITRRNTGKIRIVLFLTMAVSSFYLRRSRQVLRGKCPSFFRVFFWDICFLTTCTGLMVTITASKSGSSRQPNLDSILTSEAIEAAASRPQKFKFIYSLQNWHLGVIWAAESESGLLASEV